MRNYRNEKKKIHRSKLLCPVAVATPQLPKRLPTLPTPILSLIFTSTTTGTSNSHFLPQLPHVLFVRNHQNRIPSTSYQTSLCCPPYSLFYLCSFSPFYDTRSWEGQAHKIFGLKFQGILFLLAFLPSEVIPKYEKNQLKINNQNEKIMITSVHITPKNPDPETGLENFYWCRTRIDC